MSKKRKLISLPLDVILESLKFFEIDELVKLRVLNKTFKNIIDKFNYLWKKHYLRYFMEEPPQPLDIKKQFIVEYTKTCVPWLEYTNYRSVEFEYPEDYDGYSGLFFKENIEDTKKEIQKILNKDETIPHNIIIVHVPTNKPKYYRQIYQKNTIFTIGEILEKLYETALRETFYDMKGNPLNYRSTGLNKEKPSRYLAGYVMSEHALSSGDLYIYENKIWVRRFQH